MADKKRKKKQELTAGEPPTKEELAVADYLRFNVPIKEGKYGRMPVKYFLGSKAVDKLLESKWDAKKCKKDPLFTNRHSCVDFCKRLLLKGFFYHAQKVEKVKSDKVKAVTGKKKTESPKVEKSKKSKKTEDEKTDESKGEPKSEKPEKKEKKKKTIKLEDHEDQTFLDADEIYIWIHDPTPLKNKIIGFLLVLGTIGVCLFPLWPPEVRHGVWYLSLAGAVFVGLLLLLCILRGIIFALVWVLTMGKHHLWLLPNLTEDVGFWESFQPLYKHEYKGAAKTASEQIAVTKKTDTKESGTKNEKDSEEEYEIIDKDEPIDEEEGQEGRGEEEEDIEGEEDEEDKKTK